MNLLDLLKVFWISFAASALVAWPIYRWLKSTVKQKIDPFAPESHQAKQGTPTMGGLIILAGALCALPFVAPGRNFFSSELVRPAITLLISFGLIGFLDDFLVPRLWPGKRGLGWRQKIVLEAVAAGASAWGFVQADLASLLFYGFLILFFANAYNFCDGLDGLAGSVWLGLSLGLYMLSPERAGPIAVIIGGGVVVFLLINAPPAKVFMGDVGSLPLGAVLGLLTYAIACPPGAVGLYVHPPVVIPLLILSLLMMAELVPVPLQVAYFKLTKGKRLFPATPIHHGFEKKGWPESRVTWTFALFQLLLSLAAVTVYQLQSVGSVR